MDAARFAIEHIAVTLPGVAPGEAAGLDSALAAALVARLGGWRPDLAGAASLALGDIDLGSATLSRRLDAATLAGIIADRLVERLERALAGAREPA